MLNLQDIKPTKISFKKMTFSQVVSHLKRPYTKLSKKEFNYIMSLNADVIEYQGQLYTFGDADGKQKMLMPYMR